METIEHKTVTVNGIKMHIAEKGSGPIVLLIHGFPELWYTWRHQIISLASKGYRAIAPDLRGYGDTEAPQNITSYTCHHIVGDLISLIDSLNEDQVFVVAHDWGALISWYFSLFRPDRVKAYVCLSVPFRPRNPNMKPVDAMKAYFGEDYYMCRFQEPGKVEAQIAQSGTREVLKKIITERRPGPPLLAKENPFGIDPDHPITLPSWFTEEDLTYYTTKFDKSGFTGGLNYYRAMNLNWELTAPWTNMKVKVPVKFVVGDLDTVYNTPGVKEYIKNGGFKNDVPLLDEVVVMEGVGHFLNQEKPEEVNAHIYDYIKKF